MFDAAIITISDKGSRRERKDESGEVLRSILEHNNYNVKYYTIIPDEEHVILKELKHLSDNKKIDLIITTGGTGLSKRDVTPEATKKAIDKIVPGISEALRWHSFSITKKAMLSRGISGIRKDTLIINLPGSPKAVKECLTFLIDTLGHGLDILKGNVKECAREDL